MAPGAQVRPLQPPLTFWNNVFTLLCAVSLPHQEHDLSSFYVKHVGECPGQLEHQGLDPGGRGSRAGPLACVLSDPGLLLFTELSDKWKVTHLKVRSFGGVGSLP